MGIAVSPKETFFCSICERRLNRSLISSARLKNVARLDQRLCRQCETFLKEGLPFISEKLSEKKLTYVPASESEIPFLPSQTVVSELDKTSLPQKSLKKRSHPAPRAASAIEREVFFYQSLSVERQIEGFVKGLEAAGIDRGKLNRNAEIAINNLLQIAQTLAGQRRQSQAGMVTRADIRRMGRHVDDTALMVNEYIAAVGEESLEHRSSS